MNVRYTGWKNYTSAGKLICGSIHSVYIPIYTKTDCIQVVCLKMYTRFLREKWEKIPMQSCWRIFGWIGSKGIFLLNLGKEPKFKFLPSLLLFIYFAIVLTYVSFFKFWFDLINFAKVNYFSFLYLNKNIYSYTMYFAFFHY